MTSDASDGRIHANERAAAKPFLARSPDSTGTLGAHAGVKGEEPLVQSDPAAAASLRETDGEADARAGPDPLAGADGFGLAVAGGLGGGSRASRTRLLSRLQEERGNAYVQRVVARMSQPDERVTGLSPASSARESVQREPAPALSLDHHLDDADRQRIDAWLDEHHFGAPPGGGLAIDGAPASAAEIADKVLAALWGATVVGSTVLPAVARPPHDEVEGYISTRWAPPLAHRFELFPPPDLAGPAGPLDSNPSLLPPLQKPGTPPSGSFVFPPPAGPLSPGLGGLPGLQLTFLPPDQVERVEKFVFSHVERYSELDPILRLTEPYVYFLNGIRTPHAQLVTMVADALDLASRSLAVGIAIDAYYERQRQLFGPVPPLPASGTSTKLKDTYSTAVNWAWHARADSPGTKADTPRDKTIQLQFTRGTDSVQAVYQLSYNATTNPPQVQMLGGGQVTGSEATILSRQVDAASVDQTAKTLIGVQPFVQILGGVAQTGQDAAGTAWVLQPSAGAQVTLHLEAITLPPGLDVRVRQFIRSIQIVVQDAGSVTAQGGQPTTVENNLTLQISFTIPGS